MAQYIQDKITQENELFLLEQLHQLELKERDLIQKDKIQRDIIERDKIERDKIDLFAHALAAKRQEDLDMKSQLYSLGIFEDFLT